MKIFYLLAILLFISGCSNSYVKIISDTTDTVVYVEVADNSQERSQGLMYREKLDENNGMLFIFPNEQYANFWMKNTLIPLDLIFISEDKAIVEIKENFEPCKSNNCESNNCESYNTKEKVKCVLEVNSGFVEKKDIKIGNKIDISKI